MGEAEGSNLSHPLSKNAKKNEKNSNKENALKMLTRYKKPSFSLDDDIYPYFYTDEPLIVNNKFTRYIQNNLKFGAHTENGNFFAQKRPGVD